MLSVLMMRVLMVSVLMLSVLMLSVLMVSVLMLHVITLSVIAYAKEHNYLLRKNTVSFLSEQGSLIEGGGSVQLVSSY
jgi:hypothetical protein